MNNIFLTGKLCYIGKALSKKKSIVMTIVLLLNTITYAVNINNVYAAEEVAKGYTAIRTIAELAGINNNTSGNYILMNDIDLDEDTREGGDWDTGYGWKPIDSFSGTFNGNGHAIKSMHIYGDINNETGITSVGLFQEINGGRVENLRIENADINITSNASVGAIAGKVTDSDVCHCGVSGSIIGTGGNVGGITGSSTGDITECYNTAYVKNTGNYAGGIAGYSTGNNDCDYNTGTIEASGSVGGIIGGAGTGGLVSESYNVGLIRGINHGRTNAIAGSGIVSHCYYLLGTANYGSCNSQDTIDSCILLNDNQMIESIFYQGFDYKDTWEIDSYSNYKYPQLKNNRQIRAARLNLKPEPEQREYKQGEELNLSGGKLEVVYEDGSEQTIQSLTPDMVRDYDSSKTGTQAVRISYAGNSCEYTVNVAAIGVTSISITSENGTGTIIKGTDSKLIADVAPVNASDKTLTWESSDTNVAEVDNNGVVSARKVGTALITVKIGSVVSEPFSISVINHEMAADFQHYIFCNV